MEDEFITKLSLEVKPPKVPMKKLIEKGYLRVGEILYDKNGKEICKVNEDGKVCDGIDILSIHKMSAKYLGKTNNNGWDYFYIKNKELIPLDKLRYNYQESEE